MLFGIGKKYLTIVIICAVGTVILGAYLILFVPLMGKLGSKYMEARSLEADVVDTRGIIKTAGEVYGQRVLMSEEEAMQAINETTAHGRIKGVDFVSMNPGEIITTELKGETYKVLPVEIVIESTYEELGVFLGSLDDLEKGVVKVESFDIRHDTGRPGIFITNLVIHIYLSAR